LTLVGLTDNVVKDFSIHLNSYENISSQYDMIYLLTAIELTPGGSSTVHIYTQTVHRTTQWDRIPGTKHT